MANHKITAVLAFGLSMALAAPAGAQLFNRPPAAVPGGAEFHQAQGVDSAGLLVKVDRLENQVRNLNGQIEQMQFQMRRMEDQLRKFQQDVDFRFQELSGKPAPRQQPATTPQRRGDLDQPSLPSGRTARRGDAFDPEADPAAPGAPRQLGVLDAPSQNAGLTQPRRLPSTGILPPASDVMIDDEEPLNVADAPLDLNPRTQRNVQPQPRQTATTDPGFPTLPRLLPSAPAPALRPAQSTKTPAIGAELPNGPAMAALPPATGPAADYDAAMAAYRGNQFEVAGNGLQDFLRKYPKDRRISEAVFYLGESFAKRGRHREAAEQYLKVSTDYSKASRAPEAMVKLAMSLDKLGLKEQACATFNEVPRKYPNLSASLRTTAEREQKRNQC